MRLLLSVFVVALGVSAELDVFQEFRNVVFQNPKEFLNGPEDPPEKHIPVFDKILDKVQLTIPEILLFSNETRFTFGEVIKTIFDFEIPKNIREKKLNELIKKLGHEYQEEALKMSQLFLAVHNQLEETYPLTTKTQITLGVDLLLQDDFLKGSREAQRKMLWKMGKAFVNKIMTDKRIQKELNHTDDSDEESEDDD